MLESSKNEQYTYESKIGEGSFSEVFKVKQKSTEQYFAAKRLTKLFQSAKEVEDYAELKVLRDSDGHTNVTALVDHVYEKSTLRLTLIFNLMDCSLYDLIVDRKRRLSENRCKNYLFQLGHGLLFLHSHNIFHRDIKPENCLLRINTELAKTNPMRSELIQLADLGSATNVKYPLPRSEYVSTRWYRSPECLLTRGFYGAKMDVWALGCVFYEMLTLKPLFPGENEIDQLDKIHSILGSPSKELLKRFTNLDFPYSFPRYVAVCMHKHVPMLSLYGVDVLKKTLIYHPDNRISAKKLLEHVYFDDLRNKTFADAVTTRLLFTKSETNSKTGLKKSQTSVIKVGSSVSSSSSKVLAIEEEAKYRLERNWNNPQGSFKRNIIKNAKSSVISLD